MPKHPQTNAFLSMPFRPFFLLVGLYGALLLIAWIFYLFGAVGLPIGYSPMHWHSHEMIFGWAIAAITGFLLTAMCNWTGATPLRDGKLVGLILLWLVGRIAMWTASWWSPIWVATIDLAFIPLLASYVLWVLLRHNNRRNLVLAGILIVLGLANAMMHWGFISQNIAWLMRGQGLAINMITLIMVVIGGRVIPLFTRNWLRAKDSSAESVVTLKPVEYAAIISTALLVPVDLIGGPAWLVGGTALLAAFVHLVRLAGWASEKTRREPLLWILHLGYAWIVVALALKSAAAFHLAPNGAWIHAMGVGGMGTLIVGMMSRVALGHTGRALRLPKFAILIYIAIIAAASARIGTALQLLDYRLGLFIAAGLWVAAFTLFTVLYWSILTRSRADQRIE